MAGGAKASPYSSTEETGKEMAKRFPFQIGDIVETKSFTQGFRGSWFSCKVMEVDKGGRNMLRYKLQYVNFSDEPLHWHQAYQQRHRGQIDSTELMLRPVPPPIVHDKDILYASYSGTVVVPFEWEIGDMVDWWCDKVWWEGTVTHIRANGKVKISLLKAPLGEGGIHVVDPSRLRPTLLWSTPNRWTVPIPKKKANGRPAGRLVDLSPPVPCTQADFDVVDKWPTGQGLKRTRSMARIKAAEEKEATSSDSKSPKLQIVPYLEDLRRAATPSSGNSKDGSGVDGNGKDGSGVDGNDKDGSGVDGNDKDGNVVEITFDQGNHASSMTTYDGDEDYDSDDTYEVLHLRRKRFWGRIRKFKIYRMHINRAVEQERRMRYRKHIFTVAFI